MLLVHLLVLLCTLLGLSSTQKSKPTDVLARLKAKAPGCDLKSLVVDEANWKLLEEDLTKYCSASPKELLQNSVVLCRALYYELKASCPLTDAARPTPTKYETKKTAGEICSAKSTPLTTEWIWKKLKLDNSTVELTKENFCSKLAEPDETRQLVRFFYRIAPHIRRAELAKTEPLQNTTGQVGETAKQVAGEVQRVATKVEEKALDTAQTVKGTAEQLANATKGEISETIATANKTVGKLLGKGNEMVQAALDVGKGLANQTKELIEAGKSKLDETVAEVKGAAVSVMNKTVEVIKTGVEVVKSGVGAVLNGTSNASIPATNATSELVSNSTVAVFKNVTQPVLEIKPEKTTTVATQKDESVNEDDDEDEAEKAIKTKPKEIDPIGQIPKPNLSVETKNTTGNNVSAVPSTGEKIPIAPEAAAVKPSSTTPAIEAEKKPEDGESKKKVTTVIPQEDDDEYDAGNKGPDTGRDDGAEEDTEHDEKPKKTKITNNEEDPDDPFALDPEDDIEKEYSLHNDDDRDYAEGETEKKPIINSRLPEPRQSEKKVKELETVVYRPGNKHNDYPEDQGWSGNFVTYFLVLTLFVVVGYLVLHNKNKLMGYFVEGRRTGSSRTGSRPSHRHYEQIKNVNDVIDLDMTTNTGGTTKKDPNLL